MLPPGRPPAPASPALLHFPPARLPACPLNARGCAPPVRAHRRARCAWRTQSCTRRSRRTQSAPARRAVTPSRVQGRFPSFCYPCPCLLVPPACCARKNARRMQGGNGKHHPRRSTEGSLSLLHCGPPRAGRAGASLCRTSPNSRSTAQAAASISASARGSLGFSNWCTLENLGSVEEGRGGGAGRGGPGCAQPARAAPERLPAVHSSPAAHSVCLQWPCPQLVVRVLLPARSLPAALPLSTW